MELDKYINIWDEVLAKQTQKDKESFVVLYHRYKDKIYWYLWTLLNFNSEDAQNITTDTFIKIYEYCKKNEVDNFNALIYRTAHNLAVNRIKKNQLNKTIEDDELFEYIPNHQDEELKENVDRKFKQEIINKLLQRLDEKYREVIYLYYYEEKSYDEIADMIGSNKNSVWTLISRAKKQMQTLVEKYGLQNIF